MDKETILRFINTLIERHPSDSVSVHQLRDILAEQQAPSELIALVDQVLHASTEIWQMKQKNITLTEEDIREAERLHRKHVEERAGRC